MDAVKALLGEVKSNRRWAGVVIGGGVAALLIGAAVTAGVRHRSKRLPTGGTFETIRVEGRDLAKETTIRVTFAEEWMDVYAGGNDMTGTIMIDGATLYWSEVDSTSVGCMPDRALQDAWLSQWLNSGVTVFKDHRRLVMSSGDTKLVFQQVND